MSELISAKVLNFIYEASDSHYKVVRAIKEDNTEVMLVGYFPLLSLNLIYQFEGDFVNHPKFGVQFKVCSYKREKIDSKEGIIAYLSSERFKGIGEVTALKIYETLGSDCIKKILEDKNVLSKVKGFNKNKIDSVYEALLANENIEHIYVELYSYGLTPKMVNKLYDKYNNLVLDKIRENPYRLIYELEGFGFIKCDLLALSMGFSEDNNIRINEAIIYTLNNVCINNGFVYLTKNQLINSSYLLLNKNKNDDKTVSNETIEKAIISLCASSRIIEEDDRYYVKYLYEDEVRLSKRILSISEIKDNNKIYPIDKLNIYLSKIEYALGILYTESQKNAIFNTINANMSIITGGPGTGKTTIIKGVLYLLSALEGKAIDDREFTSKVLLCAPTGRAAKRLGEACNMQSTTIHRALGYDYDKEFSFNEDNKLPYSIIIIDESSMIDVSLAANLFSAINNNAKVIMVGDMNQLPSVGPGNVLQDIISSDIITTSKLKEIMRQSLNSDIVKLSIDINNNHINYDLFKSREELFFYSADSVGVLDKILKFVKAFIDKGGDLEQDLQILIPMYSGVCGIDAVNSAIQKEFNHSEIMITRGNKTFKLNDKVLQLANDPVLGIMNGDIGCIKDICKEDDSEFLYIDFDGMMVKYPSSELDNLNLAYAISIHKSQGSEYKNVIMPIVSSYYVMLKRKLIYTGVTRAKNKLIIIGDYNALVSGISSSDDLRQTTLLQRLLNKLDSKKIIHYINDPEIPFDTLGEEGMENITPYTFMSIVE